MRPIPKINANMCYSLLHLSGYEACSGDNLRNNRYKPMITAANLPALTEKHAHAVPVKRKLVEPPWHRIRFNPYHRDCP